MYTSSFSLYGREERKRERDRPFISASLNNRRFSLSLSHATHIHGRRSQARRFFSLTDSVSARDKARLLAVHGLAIAVLPAKKRRDDTRKDTVARKIAIRGREALSTAPFGSFCGNWRWNVGRKKDEEREREVRYCGIQKGRKYS